MKLERRFLNAALKTQVGLGVLATAISGLVISVRFGYSLAMGCALSATSLWVTMVAVEKMMQGALKGQKQVAFWAVVLAFKLAALFGAVVIALAFIGAQPVAFVIGFKLLLPALGWQAYRTSAFPREAAGEPDDDIESL